MFTKAPFQGSVIALLAGADRAAGLEKTKVPMLDLRFEGIVGDCHAGLTRLSDTRTLRLYQRNIRIKNTRQVSIVSRQELSEIAAAMGIADIQPEWVAANMVLEGVPDLTLLPPSTRLQFPSGATLTIDLENGPCRQSAEAISAHRPDQHNGFVAAAQHKRGVTAWVEREGPVKTGDAVTLFLPPQRIYAHA